MLYESLSKEETFKLGEEMGKNAKVGDIFLLDGDLGVGKTIFSKGFAKGILIEEEILSPTFTIICEYQSGKFPFYHFDLYRLSDESELEDIGAFEYFEGDGICLIEWANKFKDIYGNKVTKITIEKELEKGESYRKINVEKYENFSD